MFSRIAAFELRYQLRNPVFWVAVVMFFLMTFGATASDDIQIGSGGNINVNSPVAIVQTHIILTIFFMFASTAFVANVVIRDAESGFGSIVRSTSVRKFDYLIGRFTGAYLAAAMAYFAVPLGIWLGSLMPWIDPETLGPNRFEYYFKAVTIFGWTSLFLASAIFFAVATMTRSMMYTYVAVIAFLVLWVVFSVLVQRPEYRDFASYAEPFGVAAFANEIRYWTAAEANTQIPDFAGAIVINKLIWFAVSIAALALAYWRFSFSEKAASKRKLRKLAKKEARLARVEPEIVAPLPPLRPASAGWARLVARTRFEMAQVFKSPAFFVLLLIGLFNALAGLAFGNELYGTPARPVTFSLIQPLIGSFAIIPLIIAIYYGGELVWRDRDRKMHEIIDATSLPGWSYMVPKTIAVALVLFATLLISVVGAMIVQLARGVADLEFDKFFAWYLLPLSADMVILAILAVFVQALSPNKYVGWAIMVLYVVATSVLSNMGFEHPLYLYGSTGSNPISDLNANEVGKALGWWLRLYWGAVALILAVLAHLLWRRGADAALKPRLKRLPARLASPAGAVLAGGLVMAIATGAYLFNQMNVINTYTTQDDREARTAAYEKKYLKYETVPQPSVTDVKLAVDLYPEETRMEVSGRYRLVNDTDAPIDQLHVRLFDDWTKVVDLDVAGAKVALADEDNQYWIYAFDEPLQPGDEAELMFATRRWQQALRANENDTRLVANGTFLNSGEFAPLIGMDRSGLLQDRATRRKYGLEAELRPAKLEDESALQRNYVGNADWVMSDITLSTTAGQTPIAPGRKVADSTADGRRTARFVSQAPILMFFSVMSADYAKRERTADGVELQVYYHPTHEFNVERMLDAMGTSLAYYEENFGPYQFDYARIIEFPGYASFAQAFAGTIPYSESIGFIADTGDAEDIDYVTYVTAHELGHQYWAHQLISADRQGGTIMVETLAQYSALMVMKQLYGEDKIRRFLKYELDTYLSSRGGELIEEQPLERVENQPYIHYRKGSVVMYLLQDRLGEDRVNAMLADLLDRYRFKGPPYASSTDLVDGFMSLARNTQERELVRDLLQRITLYDLKADEATTRELPDGRFETTLTIDAGKFYADGKGEERKARLEDVIEVGLFTARPGDGAFDRANVLFLERKPIRSGRQTVRIVTEKRPTHAGIDPYNKYVDRNSEDNLTEVT